MTASLDPNFLTNVSPTYMAELYAAYAKNPRSVEASWAAFFDGLGDDEATVLGEMAGASWTPEDNPFDFDALNETKTKPSAKSGGVSEAQMRAAAVDSIRAIMMVRAYRVRGHLEATLDPLGLEERADHPELNPLSYGFVEADLSREIFIDGVLGLSLIHI